MVPSSFMATNDCQMRRARIVALANLSGEIPTLQHDRLDILDFPSLSDEYRAKEGILTCPALFLDVVMAAGPTSPPRPANGTAAASPGTFSQRRKCTGALYEREVVVRRVSAILTGGRHLKAVKAGLAFTSCRPFGKCFKQDDGIRYTGYSSAWLVYINLHVNDVVQSVQHEELKLVRPP